MKTKLFLFASLIVGLNLTAQTQACFSTPEGNDGSGWFYQDYIIPSGYKIDSIYMNATRPGYSGSDLALNMWYCPNSASYTNCTNGYAPLQYANFTTSMYNIWLRVDTAHVNAPGLVRVNIPPDANWNQLCIAISPLSLATITCYTVPEGTDGSGWFYQDYVIPSGFKIDSIQMTATRPGYSGSDLALNMWYCPNSTSYTNCANGYAPLAYANFTTSMYDVWLKVDTANVDASGMIRVNIPPDANWSQLCIATSPLSTTGIKQVSNNETLSIYPNPARTYIYLDGVKSTTNAEIYNAVGQLVKSIPSTQSSIDISGLDNGFYYLKLLGSYNQATKFIKE